MYATITSKGQVTLPKALRDALGLKPGDKIAFTPNPAGGVIVRPYKTGTLADLFGCLPIKAKQVSIEEMDENIGKYLGEKHRRILDDRA